MDDETVGVALSPDRRRLYAGVSLLYHFAFATHRFESAWSLSNLLQPLHSLRL